MKSESTKESRQDSFYCTSQVLPLWWNSAVSHVPRSSLYKNLNTNLDSSTQKGQPVKQLGRQLQDQDSSLTQSSSQSHHGMPGHKETNEQQVEATAKSALTHGTEFLFPTAQVDYNQSVVRIPYTYADPYFAGLVTAYGPRIHSQLYGVQAARVPLPLDLAAEPIYVNAKQYRGILRRRESRAKLEAQNKLVRARKPYLHESRHLHAMKRVRGSGGRFLNTKEVQDSTLAPSTHEQNATSSALQRFGGESLSESEVQSENGNPTSCSDLTSLSNNGEDIFSQAQPGNPAVHSHAGSALEDGGSVMLYGSEHQVLHHSPTGGRMIGYGL